jgi:hypothetical protein
MIPDLFKDDSFVLISGLSGSNAGNMLSPCQAYDFSQ